MISKMMSTGMSTSSSGGGFLMCFSFRMAAVLPPRPEHRGGGLNAVVGAQLPINPNAGGVPIDTT
jgi:hypothetical protein